MRFTSHVARATLLAATLASAACSGSDTTGPAADQTPVAPGATASQPVAGNAATSGSAGGPILLVIDASSIDNGNQPNLFSDVDVNDQITSLSQRQELRYFARNAGRRIDLFTGDVGDEGWFALTSIPASWRTAGPGGNGARNFWSAGAGLGSGADPEALLDQVAGVTPLRATGLKMLEGQVVCAVVTDSDVGINYDPLEGSLKGETKGTVAFRVLRATTLTGFSSGSLPRVQIEILRTAPTCDAPFRLLTNAPRPRSSSEPLNVRVPSTVPAPVFTAAD